MKYIIRFAIDPVAYAARFGVSIPDDSADLSLAVLEEALSDAQDAAVTYASAAVKAKLEDCEAANPVTCRYHGMKAVASDLESFLANAGLKGNVEVEVVDADTKTRQVNLQATIDGVSEDDEPKLRQAMSDFFAQDGVIGDVDDAFVDDGKAYAGFDLDIDNLNPQPPAQQSTRRALTPRRSPSTQPQPPPQPTPQPASTPASQPAPQPTTPPRRRTRKGQTSPVQPSSETPAQPPAPKPTEAPSPAPAASPSTSVTPAPTSTSTPASTDIPPMEIDDADILYPSELPPEPPPLLYTDDDLKFIQDISKPDGRLAKTIRQINSHIEKGDTDAWLGKSAPSLPKALAKYDKEIDRNRLAALAAKDPHGQIAKLNDVVNAIEASRAAGWKEPVLPEKYDHNAPSAQYPNKTNKTGSVDFSDYAVDLSKYEDPYRKQREAFKSYKPPADARKDAIAILRSAAAQKNIDKKLADEVASALAAADTMTSLEEGFASLGSIAETLGDNTATEAKRLMGAEYKKASDALKAGVEAAKKYLASQTTVSESFGYDEAVNFYTSRGLAVPAGVRNWKSWVDGKQAQADAIVARKYGRRKGWRTPQERQERVAQLRKNIALLWPHIHIYHGVGSRGNFVDKRIMQEGRIAANFNDGDYRDAMHNAFGANRSSLTADNMQLYCILSVEKNPFGNAWTYYDRDCDYVYEFDNTKSIGCILFRRGCGYWNGEGALAGSIAGRVGLTDIAYANGNNLFNPESAEIDFTGMTPQKMFKTMFPKGLNEFHLVNGGSFAQGNIKNVFVNDVNRYRKMSKETKNLFASNGVAVLDFKGNAM